MPSNKPRIVARVDTSTYNKFVYIAEKEKRTLSKQGEYIIEEYIRNYEAEHGKIILEN